MSKAHEEPHQSVFGHQQQRRQFLRFLFDGIYQRTLEKIGIDVSIRSLDGDQIQSRKQRFDFEVLVGSSGFSNSLSATRRVGF